MWKLIENKDFENLKNCFEWVQAMENIPQDPVHHAEGNVAIHTEMVLNELLKLPDFDSLEPQSKEIL
jgi:hypothetical protein